MIKRTLFILIIFLLTITVSAQYKPLLFGLRGGGSMDWMKPDADQYSNEGIRGGFSWGFMADFFLMENYSILTGFNVQYLHGHLKFPSVENTGNDTVPGPGTLMRKYNLQYIQVPLVLKMQAEVSEKIHLFGKIGLGTGFRLRAKADDTFTSEDGQVIESKHDIADEITLIRTSLLIGGGVAITLNGSTALIFDLTYDNGFVNILKGSNPANPGVEQKAVLNFVEIGAGILF